MRTLFVFVFLSSVAFGQIIKRPEWKIKQEEKERKEEELRSRAKYGWREYDNKRRREHEIKVNEKIKIIEYVYEESADFYNDLNALPIDSVIKYISKDEYFSRQERNHKIYTNRLGGSLRSGTFSRDYKKKYNNSRPSRSYDSKPSYEPKKKPSLKKDKTQLIIVLLLSGFVLLFLIVLFVIEKKKGSS